jgi:hypothetical protein
MHQYKIIRQKDGDTWRVIWDGIIVYESHDPENGEFTSGAFADGLEMGIVGSEQSLGSHSRIKTKGWGSYLEVFDTYEEFID